MSSLPRREASAANRARVSVGWRSEQAVAGQLRRFNALSLPFALDKRIQPPEFGDCEAGEFPDFVILNEASSVSLIRSRLSAAAAAILPVLDATRHAANDYVRLRSDLGLGAVSRRTLAEAVAALEPMIARVRQLSPAVFFSEDPRLLLLARLFVRDRPMAPITDPAARDILRHPDENAVPGAVRAAEELASLGLLERRFFDSLTVCPHCESARLLLREHCASCGGAHLVEQPVLHHLSCAYQGPEQDFRRDNGELVCPKCRQTLNFFSLDYDRPGFLHICQSCGQASGDVEVSFACLDCGSSIAASDMASRDFYSYSLTDAGRRYIVMDPPVSLPAASPRDGVAGRVRAFAQRLASAGEPGCVLEVRLHEPAGMPAAGRAWRQTWAFFRTLLQECFVPETEIIEAQPAFFVLLARDAKGEVEAALPEIRARLERHLALAPVVEYSVHSCAELLGPAALESEGSARR